MAKTHIKYANRRFYGYVNIINQIALEGYLYIYGNIWKEDYPLSSSTLSTRPKAKFKIKIAFFKIPAHSPNTPPKS